MPGASTNDYWEGGPPGALRSVRAPRAPLLPAIEKTDQITRRLSLWLDEKRGSRHAAQSSPLQTAVILRAGYDRMIGTSRRPLYVGDAAPQPSKSTRSA
jgi:hypothetical protein